MGAVHPFRASRDLLHGFEPGIRFDDDLQPRVVATFRQKLVENYHLVGRADLWHHQPRRRNVRIKNRMNAFDSSALADGIDANDPLHSVRSLGLLEQRKGVSACLCLVLRGDPVLEFDTDDVGSRGQRLWEHVRPQARREDEGTAQPLNSVRRLDPPRASARRFCMWTTARDRPRSIQGYRVRPGNRQSNAQGGCDFKARWTARDCRRVPLPHLDANLLPEGQPSA